MRPTLFLHALLLLLASTDFTIVTSAIGGESLRWCYFKYSSQNGFGYDYVSDYTFPVVMTYIAAYSVGLAGYVLALKRGRSVLGTLGVILCILGLVSFAIEGSHWLIDHNRSWLAISPVAMFVLALITCLPFTAKVPDDPDEQDVARGRAATSVPNP